MLRNDVKDDRYGERRRPVGMDHGLAALNLQYTTLLDIALQCAVPGCACASCCSPNALDRPVPPSLAAVTMPSIVVCVCVCVTGLHVTNMGDGRTH
jgi:hypothetical protein